MAELAESQHGVVSRGQLIELGAAPSTVGGWIAERRLIPIHRAVFAVGHDSLRREGRLLAAVLACGPGAVLSYRSAAALWGIRASSAATLDVTAPLRTGRARPRIRVHRGDRLRVDETTHLDGVPCTSVARTLLDLAWVLDQRGIERAIETAERLELFDLRPLTVLLARHRGRRGTARLRRALAGFDAEVIRARSETEARFFHLCADRELPRPLVNRTVAASGESFEVDFHWPHARLVLESDSPYHDTAAARARDAHRDSALRAVGWQVIRCRWDDVVTDPTPLVGELKRRLHPRRADLDAGGVSTNPSRG